MGTISSGIGLISGIDIASLVDQLMELEARPRTLLSNRQAEVDAQRTAMMDISAQFLALRMTATTIRTNSQLAGALASSSNEDILTATASNGALPGSYQFRVARLATTQQHISGGYADSGTAQFSAGTITVQSAQARLTDDTALDVLNGQEGVRRGRIRITDRSGTSQVVDLTMAVSIGDVVEAINSSETISVQATTSDGQIVLTDLTGQTTSNLTVAEVGTGHAAADLGILSSVASSTLTGDDVVSVSTATMLTTLNHQMGIRSKLGYDDFRITLEDGSTIDVDVSSATTLGDVVDAINNDAENTGTLVASVDATADGIKLTDTSAGVGTLGVTALNASSAALDLGILATDGDADSVITGSALLSGLESVLLTRLNGGTGVDRGSISITDRDGVNSVVDLSGANTVQDVIDAINDGGVAAEVTAALNTSGNGMVLTDTSGGSGNFIVADVGGTTMAADLGITVNDTVTQVASGDLNRAFMNENIRLATLNAGRGVGQGIFRITNSLGATADVDLTQGNEVTLQDVIDEINSKGIGVTASINATGDGLLLTDTNGGGSLLTVADTSGSAASKLGIAGTAATGTTYIDATSEVTITVDASDTLTTLVTAINASDAALQASILNDGTGVNPYRLSLAAEQSGSRGALLVDMGDTGISLTEMVQGVDAVLGVGDGTASDAMLITSSTNTVTGVIDNVTLDLASADATETVTVSVTSNTSAVVGALQNLVAGFNTAASAIDTYTGFDTETMTGAILQGNGTLIIAESRLFRLLHTRFTGTGSQYETLASIGFSVSGGELTLDEDAFATAFEANPDDVRALLLDTDNGFLEALKDLTDQLAETGTGSLSIQADRLERQSLMYTDRIEAMDELLAQKRERLTNSFVSMELALSRLQMQQTALTSLEQLVSSWGSWNSR